MSDSMNIESYLAQGGVLSSPDNAPPRYRGELMRLMSAFVDSELAASAGFADSINFSPDIKARIAASRITLEKADHAGRVLEVMSSFGTDSARYQAQHDWAARLDRDAGLADVRQRADMRLAVFHYPLSDWNDAVVMNVLRGLAAGVQIQELTRVSYGPLADVFRAIAPRERRHAELGLEGLARLVASDAGKRAARQAIAYWHPRVAAGFGVAGSPRHVTLAHFGLRHQTNEALLAQWQAELDATLTSLGLSGLPEGRRADGAAAGVTVR